MSEIPPERSQDDQEQPPTGQRIPRKTIFLASALLCVPAMIPFYFALGTDNAMARVMLITLGVLVLVFNTLLVVLGVRWLERYGGQ